MKTINVQPTSDFLFLSTVMVVWKFKRIFKKLCILWLTCKSLSSEALKGKLAEWCCFFKQLRGTRGKYDTNCGTRKYGGGEGSSNFGGECYKHLVKFVTYIYILF